MRGKGVRTGSPCGSRRVAGREIGMELVCPDCATVNRVPEARLDEQPVCGKCGAGLLAQAPREVDENGFERLLARSLEKPSDVDGLDTLRRFTCNVGACVALLSAAVTETLGRLEALGGFMAHVDPVVLQSALRLRWDGAGSSEL